MSVISEQEEYAQKRLIAAEDALRQEASSHTASTALDVSDPIFALSALLKDLPWLVCVCRTTGANCTFVCNALAWSQATTDISRQRKITSVAFGLQELRKEVQQLQHLRNAGHSGRLDKLRLAHQVEADVCVCLFVCARSCMCARAP